MNKQNTSDNKRTLKSVKILRDGKPVTSLKFMKDPECEGWGLNGYYMVWFDDKGNLVIDIDYFGEITK